jgi:hypothetical protein
MIVKFGGADLVPFSHSLMLSFSIFSSTKHQKKAVASYLSHSDLNPASTPQANTPVGDWH